jgi:uncharacterized BrkB/YihY/UPF0761 family membrane protein
MTTTAQHHPFESVRDGLWTAVKVTVSQWLAHKDSGAGAAIAYYSIPLIVVAISIASLLFEREDVQKEVIDSLRSLIGNAGAGSIATMLNGAGSRDQGLFAVIIGTVALLYAAISVVMQLKEALNTVWEVPGCLWQVHRHIPAGGAAAGCRFHCLVLRHQPSVRTDIQMVAGC